MTTTLDWLKYQHQLPKDRSVNNSRWMEEESLTWRATTKAALSCPPHQLLYFAVLTQEQPKSGNCAVGSDSKISERNLSFWLEDRNKGSCPASLRQWVKSVFPSLYFLSLLSLLQGELQPLICTATVAVATPLAPKTWRKTHLSELD